MSSVKNAEIVVAQTVRLHFGQDRSRDIRSLVEMRRKTRVCQHLSVRPRRPEVFAFSADIVRDDLVRRRKYLLCGAVVLFEPDDLCSAELMLEIKNVVYIRAHKAVNALVVVSDNAYIAAAAKQADKFVLERVRVLILIHENVVEPVLYFLPDFTVFRKQANRFKYKVVEIECVRFPEPFFVSRVYFGNFRERRIFFGRNIVFELFGRHKARFRGRDRLAHRPRRICVGAEPRIFYDGFDQFQRVLIVIYREIPRVAEPVRIHSQNTHARAVKGHRPYPLCGDAEFFDP